MSSVRTTTGNGIGVNQQPLTPTAPTLDETLQATAVDINAITDNDPIVSELPSRVVTVTNAKGELCIDGCKHRANKKGSEQTVQCHQCQHWIHPSCVEEKDEDIINIWTCPSCRVTPSLTRIIYDMLITMQNDHEQFRNDTASKLNDVHHKLSQRDGHMQKLVQSFKDKTTEHEKALRENADLRAKVSELSTKLSEQSWNNFRSDEKSLVVGSSIIKDISSSKLDNTEVVSKSGGKISDASTVVSSRPTNVYNRIILVTGGNDCDPKDNAKKQTAAEIVEQYRSLVRTCKEKAKSVTVSSVCPRVSTDEVKSQIESVNAGLKVMCDTEDVTFIDSTTSFHLADGTVNDAYFLNDGVHLTYKATNKLSRNLKLKIKDEASGVCDIDRRKGKQQRNTTQSDYSQTNTDIPDLSQGFWSHATQRASQGRRENKSTPPKPTTPRQYRPKQQHSTTDEVHCYNCYESNHTAQTCRHERPIRCNTCGMEGHKAKHHTY